eukprot:1415993-Rhodomonas_salina.2
MSEPGVASAVNDGKTRDLVVGHHEVGEGGLGHVDVDAEGDGDDAREEDDEAHEGLEPGVGDPFQRDHHHRERKGQPEQHLRQRVDLHVHLPDLGLGRVRVHRNARLGPRVDHQPCRMSAAHHCVGPQRVVNRQRFDPLGLVPARALPVCPDEHGEVADEAVNFLARLVAVDRESQVQHRRLRLQPLAHRDRAAQLPVGLAVELVRADED